MLLPDTIPLPANPLEATQHLIQALRARARRAALYAAPRTMEALDELGIAMDEARGALLAAIDADEQAERDRQAGPSPIRVRDADVCAAEVGFINRPTMEAA